MERNKDIQNELMQIAPTLTAVSFVHPYTVHKSYFEALPLMIAGKHKQSYDVPQGYFDGLAAQIINKIQEANDIEQDELPAIFSTLKKTNVYQMPAGYFDQSVSVAMPELNQVPEAKVVALNKPKRKYWMYAAAAAVIAMGLFTAVLLSTGGKPTGNSSDAMISGTNVTYKEITNLNLEAAIDSLNQNEVEQYLCDNGLLACNDNKEEEQKLEQSLEQLDISDEELDKFLDETN